MRLHQIDLRPVEHQQAGIELDVSPGQPRQLADPQSMVGQDADHHLVADALRGRDGHRRGLFRAPARGDAPGIDMPPDSP